MVVCQHHLDRFRDPGHVEGGRMLDSEVDLAAGKVVSGLSLARLIELENKTNSMLRSGQPVDGEFWDLVLKKIHVEKAIVRNHARHHRFPLTIQSKLNSIHEVVLKNRLEQFKKRQREDAARVQAEMGGTLAGQTQGSTLEGEMQTQGGDEADDEMDEDDLVEEYDPSMSPRPVELREIHMDDRRLPVVTEAQYLRDLASSGCRLRPGSHANKSSSHPAIPSRRPRSCQSNNSRGSRIPNPLICRSDRESRRPSSRLRDTFALKLRSRRTSWAQKRAKRSLETWRMGSMWLRLRIMTGATDTDLESLDTSTGCTLVSNGAGIIRHITSPLTTSVCVHVADRIVRTIHLPR